MPFDPTIPLQTQQPSLDSALKPISSFLQVQNAAQQLQTGKLQQQQLAAQLQERQNLSGIDWNQFKNPDGTFDGVSAGNAALKASPAYFGPQLQQQMLNAAKDQITIKTGLQSLNQAQRTDIGSGLGALSMKPNLKRGDILDWSSQYLDQNPNAAPVLLTGLKHLPASDDPQVLHSWLETARNSVLSPANQGNTTSFVNTGGQTNAIQNNPYVSGGLQQTGALPNTMAPGTQEDVQTDALGNRYVVSRSPQGTVLSTRPVPGSYNVGSGQAPTGGPANLPPGGQEAVHAAQTEVDAARAQANSAPVMHDINRTITQMVDGGVTTGGFGGVLQKLRSATGYTVDDKGATDINILGKMLERQALTAAQSMGPQTNAGLEAQMKANGTLEYTPQAIRQIAQLNDALTSGAEHYRTGLETVLQQAGGNPMAKRQFDQAWSANFDPTIEKLVNAKANGDTKTLSSILDSLGGPNSPQAKAMAAKARNLSLLQTQGHL